MGALPLHLYCAHATAFSVQDENWDPDMAPIAYEQENLGRASFWTYVLLQ